MPATWNLTGPCFLAVGLSFRCWRCAACCTPWPPQLLSPAAHEATSSPADRQVTDVSSSFLPPDSLRPPSGCRAVPTTPPLQRPRGGYYPPPPTVAWPPARLSQLRHHRWHPQRAGAVAEPSFRRAGGPPASVSVGRRRLRAGDRLAVPPLMCERATNRMNSRWRASRLEWPSGTPRASGGGKRGCPSAGGGASTLSNRPPLVKAPVSGFPCSFPTAPTRRISTSGANSAVCCGRMPLFLRPQHACATAGNRDGQPSRPTAFRLSHGRVRGAREAARKDRSESRS